MCDHGYDEMIRDRLLAAEVVDGIGRAELVEDYPAFPKGPCVLVPQNDDAGQPIHVGWGIPRNFDRPAVLITAYRPDASRWSGDFKTRR